MISVYVYAFNQKLDSPPATHLPPFLLSASTKL